MTDRERGTLMAVELAVRVLLVSSPARGVAEQLIAVCLEDAALEQIQGHNKEIGQGFEDFFKKLEKSLSDKAVSS